jgi:seryl-tRNA synthetase
MIDLRAARSDADVWRRRLARKGAAELFDELLDADRTARELQPQVEELRSRRKLKGKPTPEQLAELERIKQELQTLEEQFAAASARVRELLDRVPNPPDDSAPDGTTDEDAEELRKVGEPPSFAFPLRDHSDLGQLLGIDTERAAKVSGSRFAYRVGDVALLELALYRYALDRLVEKGFVPVLPPVLVREPAMYGTGFLPTDEVNIYRVERDDLYLTGTAEVGLASMHMEEILDEDALPLRYAGMSTNFRREAGAAGKDTRGMFRVHQFDKVEMFVFTFAEQAQEEHERLLAVEEELIGDLGIPYRVVNIAAGDLGASAAKKYDIEGWFPAQQRYRELTSTSNTTDYQSRRLDVRVRRVGKPELVYTLNGTAITARSMLAILENFQEEDGSIAIPELLWAYGAPHRLTASDGRRRLAPTRG